MAVLRRIGSFGLAATLVVAYAAASLAYSGGDPSFTTGAEIVATPVAPGVWDFTLETDQDLDGGGFNAVGATSYTPLNPPCDGGTLICFDLGLGSTGLLVGFGESASDKLPANLGSPLLLGQLFGDLTGIDQTDVLVHFGAESFGLEADAGLTRVPFSGVVKDPTCSAGPAFPDFDGDGVCDADDNCLTVANANQTDADNDTVGDVCDTCLGLANPPFTGTVLANMTLVSGQRDDDGDGVGNKCDFKYETLGSFIAGIDLNDMRASVPKSIGGSDCGVSLLKNCAQFDNSESGGFITGPDINLLRARVGTANGPSCGAACTPPLSGAIGSGSEVFGKAICDGPAC